MMARAVPSTPLRPLRAGVIGGGNMGSHHARIYASLQGICDFAGVHDLDGDRARLLVARTGGRAYATAQELLADVDVVTIASPSAFHVEHALLALEHGVDVLIEKPIALSVADGRRLLHAATARPDGPIVQVGHVEHYNPAVREVTKLLAGERIVAIDMQRLSPYDGRITDADVVQDLMLHDIHVLLVVAGSDPAHVQAVGRAVRSGATDYAVATFQFAGGLIGTLAASRVTDEKVRRMTVTTESGYITVDYLRRTVDICRSTSLSDNVQGLRTYRQESVVERVFVPIEEPLLAQLRAFLESARERRAPEVGLAMGLKCLAVVETVREQVDQSRRALAQGLPVAA
jgi:predicted dehydrogenase